MVFSEYFRGPVLGMMRVPSRFPKNGFLSVIGHRSSRGSDALLHVTRWRVVT